jgi:SpoVK/Ycf46/Vps4 family AAA+-type ATPase
MAHRKKHNYVLNPYNINNYNKFLISLDKSSSQSNINKKIERQQMETQKMETNNNNKIIERDKSKQKALQLIEEANEIYETINNPNYIGKSDLFIDLEVNDPNIYQNYISKTKKQPFKRIPTPNDEIENEINSKIVFVNIDEEIKSVADILKLIETYKLEPDLKYNINMKALHNIKEPLEELNNMIGMNGIKNNVVDQILYFIQNLHKNKNNNGDFMHTVIYGPPGTGKTEVAKIMGKIFSKMGILSKDNFLKVTRSDLIAGYLGQTALKTRDVIKDALGGVLFIDEAYALGNSEKKDSFSKECIDTLCEALSDHKDDLMVIIAGYENELKECFFNFNQGLDSRFTWRFKTDEYTAEDLYQIFLKKVKDIGWSLKEDTKITPCWFKQNMDYFKFYGRDIETVLAKTKIAHSRRVFCKSEDEKTKITLTDLENGFQTYINNSEVKKRKENEYLRRQIHNSIYC